MMCAQQQQCVLYTVSDGPLPVYTVHLLYEGMPSFAYAHHRMP